MFSLKSDEHLLQISEKLYNDEQFSDIQFMTDNGTFHGHSSLIFQHIASLADLVCEVCKAGHEKLVIFLPGISTEWMETAMEAFYLEGNPTKLRSIFVVTNVNTQNETIQISKNTSKLIIERSDTVSDSRIIETESDEKVNLITRGDVRYNGFKSMLEMTSKGFCEKEEDEIIDIKLDILEEYEVDYNIIITYHLTTILFC